MTTQKKELAIRLAPDEGNLYEIHYENGGQLPEELTGKYTSRRIARVHIANYLHKRDKKSGPSKKTTGNK